MQLIYPLVDIKGIPNIFVKWKAKSADTLELLSLDVLEYHSLTADTVSNILVKTSTRATANGKHVTVCEWNVPLSGASGHNFIEIACRDRISLTAAQLSKLCCQFVHPSSSKL